MLPKIGNSTLDAYLATGFAHVRGMSSGFAATICGHLMARQSALGIAGHVGEIGTFEGRFFIALAMGLNKESGLNKGEHAVGIDIFTWPSEKVLDHLHENCAKYGLTSADYTAIKADTSTMKPEEIINAAGGGQVRIFHIDGEHNDANLSADLALALPCMHEKGLIVLDDMLHPGYPELVDTVHRWLRRNPDWRVLAIIDREDIVAAAKYVLCRVEATPLYENFLLETFAKQVYPLGCHVVGHFTAVLTPHPRVAVVE